MVSTKVYSDITSVLYSVCKSLYYPILILKEWTDPLY